METEINSGFDFAHVAYLPMHKRTGDTRIVRYGRALLQRAGPDDTQRIATWLSEERVFRPLGLTRAPAARNVRRFELPDGTGTMESVEFLTLREREVAEPVGFYLCYESRRARWQEVDFAFGPECPARSVTLLRAGKIAVLTRSFAGCGAERVQWCRRRADSATGRFVTHGEMYVITLGQFVSLLRRLETHRVGHAMPVISDGV